MWIAFAVGGFSLHGAASAAAALIGFTGLAAGTGRYAVMLLGWAESRVERATAVGFFLGILVGGMVLHLESRA